MDTEDRYAYCRDCEKFGKSKSGKETCLPMYRNRLVRGRGGVPNVRDLTYCSDKSKIGDMYKNDGIHKMVATGDFHGFPFFVATLAGSHPVAYIEIPDGHKMRFNVMIEKKIQCHGGITFYEKDLWCADHPGWFIGMDFAHKGDCSYRDNVARLLLDDEATPTGRKWTIEEIKAEVESICAQLVALGKKGLA